MKKLYVSLMALMMLLLPSATWADTVKCLMLTESNGTVNKFALNDAPIVTYEGNDMVIKSNSQTLTIGLEGLKVTFGEMDVTGIRENGERSTFNAQHPTFSFGIARFEGLQPGASVRIYSVSGKCLKKVKADNDGRVEVSMTDLPKGVYIINTPTRSFKIKY